MAAETAETGRYPAGTLLDYPAVVTELLVAQRCSIVDPALITSKAGH